MVKKKFYWLLAIAVILSSLTLGPLAQVQAQSPEPVDVLVTFYQPPGPDETELIESLGGTVKVVYHIVPTVAAIMPAEKLDELLADPRVESVEPDITLSACFAGEVLPWGVDRVDAELVHPSNKGTGVKVAILDSGIDLDHPDLVVADNVTFVSGTTSGDDDNGHGTLVAGIVAALDNDIGVIGVAPEASLYAVKVLNENGGGMMSVILSGIEWAVDNNMQVINISFGGLLGWPYAVRLALQNAYDAGIVILAGAGNGGTAGGEGENVWSPARYEPAIAVGATDALDARYSSSSTGCTLELAAPGVSIYSTAMDGGYAYITGTSASCSHATGVATLLIASGMTSNVDVRQRLRSSAEDLGESSWDTQFGWGMVNANLAINFTPPSDQIAPTTTISLSGTVGGNGWYLSDVEVTLSATDDGGSGVAKTEYCLGSYDTWNLYTTPFTITTEGTTQLLVRSWDNACNGESPAVSEAVQIDRIAPTTTAVSLSGTMGDNDWYVSDVEVTLTATDNEGGSGVAETKYSLDAGETWQTYSSPFTITTEGTIQILARSWDNAGNDESPPVSETFKIDQTPPTLTETAIPAEIDRIRKGEMVDVDYTGTAEDSTSGIYGSTMTVLIDEYGELNQDLGSVISGTVSVEAWCDGTDKPGRTYIFRLTARDFAGHEASAEAIVIILHP